MFYELADSSYVTDVSVVNRSRVDFKLNEKGQDFIKKQTKTNGDLALMKKALTKPTRSYGAKKVRNLVSQLLMLGTLNNVWIKLMIHW